MQSLKRKKASKKTSQRSGTNWNTSDNHILKIEIGLHKKTPKEMCGCPFCQKSVENEFHFLLIYQTYTILKDNILNLLGNRNPMSKFLPQNTQI